MDSEIIIQVPEGESLTLIVEDVLRQLENGYTSGYNPTWEIRNK